MKRISLIVSAGLLAATFPAQAQPGALSEGQMELFAEMWTMGSVCHQCGMYEVDAAGLANHALAGSYFSRSN